MQRAAVGDNQLPEYIYMTQLPSSGEPRLSAEDGWTHDDNPSFQEEPPREDEPFGAGLTARGGGTDDGSAGGSSRRRPRRRRRTSSSDEDKGTGTVAVAEEPKETGGGDDDDAPKRPRRRRGSRGGRRRKKADPEAEASETDEESRVEEAPAKKSRSRRGRRRAEPSEEESSEKANAPDESDSRDEEADSEPGKRKRRRGSRGGRNRRKKSGAVGIEAIPGEEDELLELPAEAELVDKPADKASGKKRRRKKASKREESDDPPPQEEEVRDQVILVNASDPEEARVAVVEDSLIVDLQMTVHTHRSFVNDIYRGRVVNLEAAIGAAFVDFGQGRNGFLHASDVMDAYGESDWDLNQLLTHRLSEDELGEEGERLDIVEEDGDSDEEAEKPAKRKKQPRSRGRSSRRRPRQRRPISELLKKGAPAVIQITKDAIGDKGPTLTTYISIPGRYLVLMPSLSRTGVSRKIDDEKERRRLKRILQSLDIPEGMGVIVRTAGIGKTKTELRRDLEYLLIAWDTLSKRLTVGRSPIPLYQESDVAIRTMRDLFSSRTEAVIVDDQHVYERMVEFTKALMPEHVDRIRLHDGARPLFHTHGVEQDFEKTFSRRVELPSGGSIVIDQTEALVAIDVNSGRTRDEGADFEDIALKTNLEAVPEITRQMRLRDLGGIIVLDFIDMARPGSRRAVEKALREALSVDRARSKIGRISQFGLLELTRQRLGPGMQSLLYDNCIRCRGTGRQRTAESRAQAILRRLGSALTLKGFSSVEVCAHPEVVEYMQRNCSTQIRNLRESSGRELRFKSVPDQVEDSVLHYLRADGREVRPGGRRKR